MVIAGGTTNSYEVVARLATGGMAEVFLARVTSVDIQRYVVLKRVLPELAVDQQFVTMFLDEARLAAQLRHPNIAQLYDVGRLGSTYFYTMEYVHGATAWLMMERAAALGTPVPLAHVLTIAGGVSAALHHAHTRVGVDRKPLGIVHRDVTPANIMVSGEGQVKLLDFGVAKAQGRRTVTRVGTIKGKIAYLSPEQCTSGATIDGRSDIFSLGICLYELLTLHQLFQRIGDLPTMTAIVHEHVPPPSHFRPEVPPELDRIVMTALAKDPAQRFTTADAMHAAVEDAAATLGIATSVTALARYMTSMFGQPPEPWLELEPAAAQAVTVVAAPLVNLDTTIPVPRMSMPETAMNARDSADLDERIKKMRDVRPSAPRMIPTDAFDDETNVDTLNGEDKKRLSIPLAAQTPGWDANTSQAPAAIGFQFDNLDRTAPEPLTAFDDDPPSDVKTIATPRTPLEAIAPAPPSKTPLPLERPVASRPNVPSVTPLPLRIDTWEREKPASWNVPRLVMAGAIIVGIIVAIVFAAC
jgi:serine/threonine protein kinase